MKKMFRHTLFCIALLVGSLTGGLMRPDKIEELLAVMNGTSIEVVLQEDESGSATIQ